MYDDEEVYDRVSLPHGSELPAKSTLKPFERVGRPNLMAVTHPNSQPSLNQTRRGQARYGRAPIPADLEDDEEVIRSVAEAQAADVALGGPPHLPGAGVGAVSTVGHRGRVKDDMAALQAQAAEKALAKKLRAIELRRQGVDPAARKPRPQAVDHVGALLHGFPSDVPEDRMTEYQRASKVDDETLHAMSEGCDRRHLRKKNSMTEHRETYVRIRRTMQDK